MMNSLGVERFEVLREENQVKQQNPNGSSTSQNCSTTIPADDCSFSTLSSDDSEFTCDISSPRQSPSSHRVLFKGFWEKNGVPPPSFSLPLVPPCDNDEQEPVSHDQSVGTISAPVDKDCNNSKLAKPYNHQERRSIFKEQCFSNSENLPIANSPSRRSYQRPYTYPTRSQIQRMKSCPTLSEEEVSRVKVVELRKVTSVDDISNGKKEQRRRSKMERPPSCLRRTAKYSTKLSLLDAEQELRINCSEESKCCRRPRSDSTASQSSVTFSDQVALVEYDNNISKRNNNWFLPSNWFA